MLTSCDIFRRITCYLCQNNFSWFFCPSLRSFRHQWCIPLVPGPSNPRLALRQSGVCQRHASLHPLPQALGSGRRLWVLWQPSDRPQRLLLRPRGPVRGTGHQAQHGGQTDQVYVNRWDGLIIGAHNNNTNNNNMKFYEFIERYIDSQSYSKHTFCKILWRRWQV